jgi:hypothetical protein
MFPSTLQHGVFTPVINKSSYSKTAPARSLSVFVILITLINCSGISLLSNLQFPNGIYCWAYFHINITYFTLPQILFCFQCPISHYCFPLGCSNDNYMPSISETKKHYIIMLCHEYFYLCKCTCYNLTLKGVKLRGGAIEKWLGHEGSNPMDRISYLRRELEEVRFSILSFYHVRT